MRLIHRKLREQMANDPFYGKCCISDVSECSGDIQWHHNIIVAGRQLNADWAILPVCKRHHDMANDHYVREKLNWVMLNRATIDQLKSVSKAINYISLKERLNKIYGNFHR